MNNATETKGIPDKTVVIPLWPISHKSLGSRHFRYGTDSYLTTGTGSIYLDLPGQEKYIGLLWGSVDNYNTLQLYNESTLVATITGSDVAANANGNQGELGTYYVNITSTDTFNRVVATSSSNAFELDNVAFNPTAIPEPSSIIMAFLGGVGLFTYRHARRRGLSSGNKV